MISKHQQLFITFLSCFFLHFVVFSSGFNTRVNAVNIISLQVPNHSFLAKEFSYIAPLSSEVYLVWSTEDASQEELVSLNEHTEFNNGLFYTPMSAVGDTFKLALNLPKNSNLNYNFWITKNKQGHYSDYWDLQSGGTVLISDETPIQKTATYSISTSKTESKLLAKGWVLLLLLILILTGFTLVKKGKKNLFETPVSYVHIIVFVGISVILLQALARIEVLQLNFSNLLKNPKFILKVTRASFQDLGITAIATIVFSCSVFIIKNIAFKKTLTVLFTVFALFSTVIAFINIQTVLLLGKPFTYQWLYYSDFLGSEDAKSALQENMSITILFNLMAYSVSLLLLAYMLYNVYKYLNGRKTLKYMTLSLLSIFLLVLFYFSNRTEVTWSKGQSENAITAFMQSVIIANSKSSFFAYDNNSVKVPFDPAKSSPLENPILLPEDHHVKNVLVIVLESAGSTYFDAYGGNFNLSPNLNKYAQQSLIFDQMYAHSPATNFSMVSMLASMYPDLSFKSITQENPDINHPTISSELKSNGYRTSFFTSSDLRFQNCDTYLAHRKFDLVEDFSKITCTDQFQLADENYKEGNGINDLCLADRLSTWLDQDPEQKFFSMLWTVQGHYPYFFEDKEHDFKVSNLSFNRYLNCLQRNDELIGLVMQMLEDRNLASSTLVVVTGDHGEAFGQHSQYGHGTGIYEENLKVPLYLINPVLFNGQRVPGIASMKDLATTILPIINVQPHKVWQGQNLLTTRSDEAYYFAPWSDYLFGYRNGDMKYIFNESENTLEVYNLRSDPKELMDLYIPKMEAELLNARTKIAAWVQYQGKYIKESLKN